jgi:glycosyltransferase involved in cell wall biosynthesis
MAQHLSLGLRKNGHDVTVYSSSHHPYQEEVWNGIRIIHKFDPEKTLGTAGQFIYDLNCMINSRKHRFDVIINLGYTSSAVWMRLLPASSMIITNMDGLEWKRTKYSKAVQRFLKYSERLAVKLSDKLVADSLAIQEYLRKKYAKESYFIAYGAEAFNTPEDSVPVQFNTAPNEYDMLIARMEPENNIEMILDGIIASSSKRTCLVVGSTKNKYGQYLVNRFSDDSRVVFTGPIYDNRLINNLRYYCRLYFHGHSVGGTNPSLLEAMGCRSVIAAHNNEFNRSVLGDDAYYFSTSKEVSDLVHTCDKGAELSRKMVESNFTKIVTLYTWPGIVEKYERLMTRS